MRLYDKLLIFEADDSIGKGVILSGLLSLIVSHVIKLLSIPVKAAAAATGNVHHEDQCNPPQDVDGMLEPEE